MDTPQTGVEIMLRDSAERDKQLIKDIQARLREGRRGNTEVEQYYIADVGYLMDRLELVAHLLTAEATAA